MNKQTGREETAGAQGHERGRREETPTGLSTATAQSHRKGGLQVEVETHLSANLQLSTTLLSSQRLCLPQDLQISPHPVTHASVSVNQL